MTQEIIPLELKKLGFKDKEVRVYLAGLELGVSSVQKIARKAGVVRPTTYEIIRILKEKGLFAETTEKGRRFFVAQPPEKILHFLRVQKREIEEKEREFIRIIAVLESKYYSGERGGISMFHGEEGMRMLEEKVSFSSAPEILVFASRADKQEMQMREELYKKIRLRLGKVQVKELYAEKLNGQFPYGERKSLATKSVVPGTLILFDQAAFFPAENFKGYLIENQLVCELLKSFFHSLWEQIAK
ncbi:MAG TPA: helix-turn-helix domain-containing protein [Candidatus Paceibacterota bacterium]|nr:helix-turn-helix domain-containing protein [Candidatus Paceibacterota bacterium]